MNVRPPEIVTVTTLAQRLGISTRRAREHATGGLFVKVGKGFDADASAKAYMASLRRAATGRRGESKSSASEDRGRLARLQGDALEIRNKVARRELISEAEVEATWSEIVTRTRDAILAVPARIGAELGLTAFDVSVIDKHLREALTRLGAA
jgi:phage terminase Nu1 subunit (DNA packaging protein)